MSTTKPSIVFVPGSFSSPRFYTSTLEPIEAAGYETSIVDLPSTGRRDPLPAATMADDAAEVKSITSKLIEQGKDVVLVAHSYGGLVATESAKGLVKTEREAAGQKGGISHLIYLTSVVPSVGESLHSRMGNISLDFITIDGDYMNHDPVKSAPITFSDLPSAEGEEWVTKMPEHSAPSFGGPLTYAAYKDIPVSFIMCLKDKVLPLDFQKEVIEMIEKESGRKVDVLSLDSGHCPNVSMPGELAKVILQAIEQDK